MTDITVRLGTVERDGEGSEVIIWDDTILCAECGAPYDDLSRLWDGVALWVALDQLERLGGWRLCRGGGWELSPSGSL